MSALTVRHAIMHVCKLTYCSQCCNNLDNVALSYSNKFFANNDDNYRAMLGIISAVFFCTHAIIVSKPTYVERTPSRANECCKQ